MGIESTRYITRNESIQRIMKQVILIKNKNYYELNKSGFEDEPLSGSIIIHLEQELRQYLPLSKDTSKEDLESSLQKLNDEMLGDIMDLSFIRFSMFDNYIISEEK